MDSLHAKLNSHYKEWSYQQKKQKKTIEYSGNLFRKNLQLLKATKIIGQRKAFYKQRIPESSCPRKEPVDMGIIITSKNGDRTIMQSE